MPCPEIVDISQSITVIPGKAANFFCLAYSHGTLKYDWKKKNSKNLLSSSKTTECTQDNTGLILLATHSLQLKDGTVVSQLMSVEVWRNVPG